jgi:glycosyltransferase involved in cell wall biosynthesis
MNRLAIAHDWLIQARGAERLLREFCRALPEVSIYTLIARPRRVDPEILRHRFHLSPLNRFPGVGRYYRYLLPLYPQGIESLTVRNADALISVSHAVAKGIRREGSMPHVCYCLTPMRFVWLPELYGPFTKGSLTGFLLRFLIPRLKRWDLGSLGGIDRFVAISKTVQDRILKIYSRPSEVIYPCVDLAEFPLGAGPRESFYLIVSAMVPQKRLDLAVEAFNRSGRPLVLVGSGPLLRSLASRAKPNIRFLGWLPDEEVRRLYRTSRALVFPGVEDFGLVPVEAQASGCPVVALGVGGATETVRDGETGLFFHRSEPDDLNQTLSRFEKMSFDPMRLRDNAARFSRGSFLRQWEELFDRMGIPLRFEPADGEHG